MSEPRPGEVTRLLQEITAGNRHAAEDLLPLVYRELRKLARARMAKERPGQTLQPTALVHEAYLNLVKDPGLQWNSRGHFFAAAAHSMRRILVDRARRYAAEKHGGSLQRVDLEDAPLLSQPRAEELLALDQVLDRLDAKDAQMALAIQLRYFAGLTVPDTARALQVSPRTVTRLLTAGRVWLQREMTRSAAQGGS